MLFSEYFGLQYSFFSLDVGSSSVSLTPKRAQLCFYHHNYSGSYAFIFILQSLTYLSFFLVVHTLGSSLAGHCYARHNISNNTRYLYRYYAVIFAFSFDQVRAQALSLVQDWGIAFKTDRGLAFAEIYGR